MLKSLLLGSALCFALAACSSKAPGNSSPSTSVSMAPAASAASSSSAASVPSAPANAATAATTASSPANATSGVPVAAPADAGQWVEGKNYFRIEPSLPTDHPGHVVVTEVFSWGCPACNQFQPMADAIRKSLPSYARWQYLPASFIGPEDWPLFQRTYYAAQALGLDTPVIHDAVFKAIWTPGGPLNTYDGLDTAAPRVKQKLPALDEVAQFFSHYGVAAKTFSATAESFAVNARMRRADQLIKAYGVDSTPTIVVNGTYRLDVASAGGLAQTQALVLYLAQKEAATMHLRQ